MNEILLLVLLAVLLLAGLIVFPQLLVRRAIPEVIKIFKRHDALGIKNAKTVEELGLGGQTMVQRMWKPRDYKPRALQLLLNANIVQMTPDGKLYLAEENLAATKWSNIQV